MTACISQTAWDRLLKFCMALFLTIAYLLIKTHQFLRWSGGNHWLIWHGMTHIHFPRMDYSSYCTPANVGGLPGTAWLGPASQAPVRERYASWGVGLYSSLVQYHGPTYHSIIPLTHNCISSCSLQMLLWVSLLMPSNIFLLSTTCQSKSISRRQCFQLNGHSRSLPVGLTSSAFLVIT